MAHDQNVAAILGCSLGIRCGMISVLCLLLVRGRRVVLSEMMCVVDLVSAASVN